jgi:hypothetical protein
LDYKSDDIPSQAVHKADQHLAGRICEYRGENLDSGETLLQQLQRYSLVVISNAILEAAVIILIPLGIGDGQRVEGQESDSQERGPTAESHDVEKDEQQRRQER